MLIPAARRVARLVRHSRATSRAARADRQPVVEHVQGFTLHLPRHFVYHYVQHDYEPLSRAFLIEHVRPGTSALDVGAHIGLYTLLMARAVGATGRVASVEPAEENLRFLRANIEANGFGGRVEVLPYAATERSGPVEFHLTGSSDSHGLHPHPNTPTRRVVSVPGRRLDELVTDAGFVKIDTEGAELGALAGLHSVLTRPGPQAALVEWAPAVQSAAGHGLTEVAEALQDLHFAVHVLDDHLATSRAVTDVADDLRLGRLPADWYGNLACVRSA